MSAVTGSGSAFMAAQRACSAPRQYEPPSFRYARPRRVRHGYRQHATIQIDPPPRVRLLEPHHAPRRTRNGSVLALLRDHLGRELHRRHVLDGSVQPALFALVDRSEQAATATKPRRDDVQMRSPLAELRKADGDRRVTWRFHLDPAVSVELDGGDCRLAIGGRVLWLLGVEPDRRPRRIEPGWVSPSYGVRSKTNVIVIEQASGPAELSCIFSGERLHVEARQRVLSALDRQRAAIH